MLDYAVVAAIYGGVGAILGSLVTILIYTILEERKK